MPDRNQISQQLSLFRDGKLELLQIPNPMFVSGCQDLINFNVRPNFQLREFMVSILKRPNLTVSQAPDVLVHKKLADLLQNVRNKVRTKYPNFSITIVSGHRPKFVDQSVGGSGTGPHTRGWAADVQFSGIDIPGWDADRVRRGVSYEAYKLGCKGIELILGGQNVHWDPVRNDQWIVRQAQINGRFQYPNINLQNEIVAFKLPGLN